MGGLHWNPLVRIKAISMRKDAIYYSLHMPWENTWLAAPTRYAAIRQALKTAGVQVKDINVTLGGCAFWHAVISIKKQPGEGKNALLAALSVMDLKHVVVVDDDIDVNNPIEVEWAIATRVQGDRDVMIVSQCARQAARSEPAAGLRRGADRRQGRHRRHHRRRASRASTTSASPTPMPDRAKIDDYVNGKADAAGEAGDERAVAALARRRSWRRSARSRSITPTSPSASPTYDFRTVARALGHLHATEKLWQDPRGPHVRARLRIRRQAAAALRVVARPRRAYLGFSIRSQRVTLAARAMRLICNARASRWGSRLT